MSSQWLLLCAGLLLAGCTPPPDSSSFPQLRLGAVLGASDQPFARAEQPRPFEFPADHGPHPAYRSEWWYITASLQAEDGSEFGVQFTVFRQALAPPREPQAIHAAPAFAAEDNPWRNPNVYMAHVALTSVAAGEHWAEERLARGHPELAGASGEPFAVWLEDWRLHGVAGGFQQQTLRVAAKQFSLDLVLDVVKAPVLQGDAGLSAKGPGQASYYYSVPRLAVHGSVEVGDETWPVTGTAWLDREWSTSVLSDQQQGWDWFALQLYDNTEVMAFRLRRSDGQRDPYDHGLRVAADGTARPLRPEQFELVPTHYWTDQRGVRWPVEWLVRVEGQQWQVRAAVRDQTLDLALVYWEGLVRVFDTDGARVGSGYMELTGYQR